MRDVGFMNGKKKEKEQERNMNRKNRETREQKKNYVTGEGVFRRGFRCCFGLGIQKKPL